MSELRVKSSLMADEFEACAFGHHPPQSEVSSPYSCLIIVCKWQIPKLTNASARCPSSTSASLHPSGIEWFGHERRHLVDTDSQLLRGSSFYCHARRSESSATRHRNRTSFKAQEMASSVQRSARPWMPSGQMSLSHLLVTDLQIAYWCFRKDCNSIPFRIRNRRATL